MQYVSVEEVRDFRIQRRTGHVQKQVVGRRGINGTRCDQRLVSLMESRCKGIRSGRFLRSIDLHALVLIPPTLYRSHDSLGPSDPPSSELIFVAPLYLSLLLQSPSVPTCGQ